MARLRQILNALIVVLGAIIGWQEYRDPARSRRAEAPVGRQAGEAGPDDEGGEGAAAPASVATDEAATEPAPSAAGTDDQASSESATAAGEDAASGVTSPLPRPTEETAGAAPGGGRAGQAREAVPAEAAAAPASGATDVPAGAVPGNGTPDCPATHPIKGNADSMIYHAPGRATYARTIAEFCFATEADAEAAGYRAPRR